MSSSDSSLTALAVTVAPASSAAKDVVFALQVIMLLAYFFMCIFCGLLIAYIRYNRHEALKGDIEAARKIVLPAFEPLLWILAFTTAVYTAFFIGVLSIGFYTTRIPRLTSEFFHSGRQFVFLLVIVFMLQKSVSVPALRRAVIISLLLSTYTIPVAWATVTFGDPAGTLEWWAITLSRAAILVVDVYVFIHPPGRATKRTMRQFCAFALVYHLLMLSTSIAFRIPLRSLGFVLAILTLIWCALCPLVIWRVLKADTEHWRGLGQRVCALQSVSRQGTGLHERISSKGIHVLIEMHRRFVIDFAVLELKHRIGSGAHSAVFNGVLQSKTPVAIKVYMPRSFTDDVMEQFSHEAALCGSLNHPNIVQFFGMCICPPSICLVSELCLGNLQEITTSIARSSAPPSRQQAIIDIGYMIDAARAVAYMHSFSPVFLHRDIKPANFLVDTDNNVKLTDFGESRSLSREHIKRRSNSRGPVHSRPSDAGHMTVKGTVDYMAPEIINGKGGLAQYGEAADVYSLAITMWDILYPGMERYPVGANKKSSHLHVFEAVLSGRRPEFHTTIHSRLRDLITCAWQSDPMSRPTVQQIVHVLGSVQEELLAAFAAELSEELAEQGQATYNHASRTMNEPRFSGEQLMIVLEDWQSIGGAGEGLRLGHALMDAGLMHHHKHSRGFSDSGALYYFDNERIELCRPFVIVGTDTTDDDDGDSDDQESIDSWEQPPSSGPHTRKAASLTKTLASRTRSLLSYSVGTDMSAQHNSRDKRHRRGIVGDGASGVCACRQYGQRLNPERVTQRQRIRRKFKAIVEENALTTTLLGDDRSSQTVPSFDDDRIGITIQD